MRSSRAAVSVDSFQISAPVVTTPILSPAMLERWLRHNVEGVGNLEHFLPQLHAQREESEFRLSL
jgi:hypothetical protein